MLATFSMTDCHWTELELSFAIFTYLDDAVLQENPLQDSNTTSHNLDASDVHSKGNHHIKATSYLLYQVC